MGPLTTLQLQHCAFVVQATIIWLQVLSAIPPIDIRRTWGESFDHTEGQSKRRIFFGLPGKKAQFPISSAVHS